MLRFLLISRFQVGFASQFAVDFQFLTETGARLQLWLCTLLLA